MMMMTTKVARRYRQRDPYRKPQPINLTLGCRRTDAGNLATAILLLSLSPASKARPATVPSFFGGSGFYATCLGARFESGLQQTAVQEELVRILLAARADPDKYGDVDVTPLARASRHGSVAIAGMLLAAGAEKDKDSKQTFKLRYQEERTTGWTPLVEAAQHGHLGVVRLLLEAKADKDKLSHGRTALVKACEFGHVGVASFLLQEGADASRASNHCTALAFATQLGRLDLARLLLEAGASTGEDGENLPPLSWACRFGQLEMACLLLEARANVEQGCFKPLMEASQKGYPEITRALLQAGADPNKGCFIPLVEASHEGHTEIVRQLLAARADSEKRGHSDLTALEKATLRGHQEIVDLLAKGATKTPQSPNTGIENRGSPHRSMSQGAPFRV